MFTYGQELTHLGILFFVNLYLEYKIPYILFLIHPTVAFNVT